MGFHRSVHSARIFTVFSSWILSANMQSLLPLFSRLCISMSNSWSTDPQRIPLVTSLHHGNWTFTPTLFEFLVHLGICSFIPQLLAVFRRLWLGTFLNSLGKSKQNIQIHFFFLSCICCLLQRTPRDLWDIPVSTEVLSLQCITFTHMLLNTYFPKRTRHWTLSPLSLSAHVVSRFSLTRLQQLIYMEPSHMPALAYPGNIQPVVPMKSCLKSQWAA